MISLLLSLLLILNLNQPILAIEASNSADNTKSQEYREALKQKVNEKLNLIKAKSLFGTIEKINDKEISINWKDNSNTLITDNETIFINLKRLKIELEDIKPNQEILAMGYFNVDNKLETKRVIIIEMEEIANNNQVVNGQIVDVSKTTSIFTIIPHNNKNVDYQIKTTNSTIKKITEGQKIIAVIEPDLEMTNTFNLLKIIKTTDSSISATPTPNN